MNKCFIFKLQTWQSLLPKFSEKFKILSEYLFRAFLNGDDDNDDQNVQHRFVNRVIAKKCEKCTVQKGRVTALRQLAVAGSVLTAVISPLYDDKNKYLLLTNGIAATSEKALDEATRFSTVHSVSLNGILFTHKTA